MQSSNDRQQDRVLRQLRQQDRVLRQLVKSPAPVKYGFKISAGATYREVYITDIAATIASMLHIQMPNGCTGHAIVELLK